MNLTTENKGKNRVIINPKEISKLTRKKTLYTHLTHLILEVCYSICKIIIG